MLRIFFISLIMLLIGFFFLQGRFNARIAEMPIFLRSDEITFNHRTTIKTTVHSLYSPDSLQMETLKKDYSNIWAHLNHLYATNDVEKGKEYYTEDWFKQICRHFKNVQAPMITRLDEHHQMHIQNWSSDGLICTAIDSNVVLSYSYPDKSIKKTKANLAVVLLFQGDHWRIDAIRLIDEKLMD